MLKDLQIYSYLHENVPTDGIKKFIEFQKALHDINSTLNKHGTEIITVFSDFQTEGYASVGFLIDEFQGKSVYVTCRHSLYKEDNSKTIGEVHIFRDKEELKVVNKFIPSKESNIDIAFITTNSQATTYNLLKIDRECKAGGLLGFYKSAAKGVYSCFIGENFPGSYIACDNPYKLNVSTSRTKKDSFPIFLSNKATHGCSGSPLFSQNGVLGMIFAKFTRPFIVDIGEKKLLSHATTYIDIQTILNLYHTKIKPKL